MNVREAIAKLRLMDPRREVRIELVRSGRSRSSRCEKTLTALMPESIAVVSRVYGVSSDALLSRLRTEPVTLARFALIYSLRRLGFPVESVARHIGKRDHGTVLNGTARAQDQASVDAKYKALLTQCAEAIEKKLRRIERSNHETEHGIGCASGRRAARR